MVKFLHCTWVSCVIFCCGSFRCCNNCCWIANCRICCGVAVFIAPVAFTWGSVIPVTGIVTLWVEPALPGADTVFTSVATWVWPDVPACCTCYIQEGLKVRPQWVLTCNCFHFAYLFFPCFYYSYLLYAAYISIKNPYIIFHIHEHTHTLLQLNYVSGLLQRQNEFNSTQKTPSLRNIKYQFHLYDQPTSIIPPQQFGSQQCHHRHPKLCFSIHICIIYGYL